MKDGARIRSMFASISRRYDLLNHLLSLNRDKHWRRKAVELSGLGRSARVLDVCTGTADLAIEYSRALGEGGRVVGTDFCPEMLIIGKQKLAAEQPGGKVTLMVADTLRLPFPDNIFDVVSVAFGIRNVADLNAGILEMTRVAKCGSRIVVLEFSVPENRLLGGIYKVYFTRLLPVIGRVVSRARNGAYTYLPDSVLKFPQGEAFRSIMRACGLTDVSATQFNLGIVTLYVGRKP